MSAAPRDREAAAIATLVALCGPDGPDEWLPEHHDSAEAAAYVAAEWVRRDGRARIPEPQRVKRAPSKKALPRKPEPAELTESKKTVRARSGGRCEANTPVCDVRAVHVHHKAGRKVPGAHAPERLLDVCEPCHLHIHDQPEEAMARGWMESRLGPVTPHVRDEPVRAGSQDRETPE